MGRVFQMAPLFGAFPAEGCHAASFRLREVEPCFDAQDEIVLDFTGVRIVNSSFANALIVPLLEQRGETALKKLLFRGCSPVIRVMIEGALSLGLQRANENGHRATV
jgi:hypothetical protein